MAIMELDVGMWAEQQFGTCQLGDRRRTRRLVEFAAQVAADPDANTPTQDEKWSDLKAAYRLIEEEDVTSKLACLFLPPKFPAARVHNTSCSRNDSVIIKSSISVPSKNPR